jgi:hypothetical protein
VHVVDHDGRRMAGEEGCGVEVGARGLAGERECYATMSRKGSLRKEGFAGGSWSSYHECGNAYECWVYGKVHIAFD